MLLKSIGEKFRRQEVLGAAQLGGQVLVSLALVSGALLGGCVPLDPPLATGEAASELAFPGDAAGWIPVVHGAGPMGDVATDAWLDPRNLVGDAAFPAVFFSHSGSELFFRMRLQTSPLAGDHLHYAGWGVLFNTDGDDGQYEYALRVDATTSPARIVYARNERVDAAGDPTDPAERTIKTMTVDMTSAARNVAVTPADSCFDEAGARACAGASDSHRDYFLSFGVPISVFALAPAMDLSRPVQILAGTSSDGQIINFDIAACEEKPGQGTLSECESPPMSLTCGNGVREAGEGCDDGNLADGDGCTASCLIEDGKACNAEKPGQIGDDSCESGTCNSSGTCGPLPVTTPAPTAPTSPTAPTTPTDGISGLGISGGGCSAGGGGAGTGAPMLALLGLAMMWSRRRRRGLVALGGLLVAGGVTAGTRDAAAQVSTRYTAERFELTGFRDGLLGVEWGDVRGHRVYDAGMWLGYANDPINVYDMATGDRMGALVHDRVGGDLVAAVRLWDRLELGAGVPMIVSQSAALGAATMIGNDLSGSGLGDLRLSSKLTIARRGGTAVAVMAGLGLPTSNLDDYGGDHGLLFSPALAVSHARGGLRLAANVGYRARPSTQALNLKVDDEVYARTGVGYRFPSSVEIDATFDVATGANDVLGAFNRNHAELRGGVAYDLTSTVRVFGATGVGVAEGFGTPDFRALAGIRIGSASPKHAPRLPRVPAPARVETPAPAPAPIPEPAPAPAPALDTDHDRIPDVDDRCPTQPGTREHDGCPVNTRIETDKIVILKRVEFATDADTILPRSFPILQEVAVILMANPDIKRLRIEGHTDSEGAEAYNLDLSVRRSRSVKRWLVEVAGIDAGRLEARGCGESLPIADNATLEGRQENRRVEFPILDPAPATAPAHDTSKCSTVK